jgi:hypothetical protein
MMMNNLGPLSLILGGIDARERHRDHRDARRDAT